MRMETNMNLSYIANSLNETRPYTALILGAGASADYHFPIGFKLLDDIRKFLPTSRCLTDQTYRYKQELKQIFSKNDEKELFESALSLRSLLDNPNQRLVSVDSFIASDKVRNIKYGKEILLALIVHFISKCETVERGRLDSIFKNPSRQYDHWIYYFLHNEFHKCANLKIINFNYDRTFDVNLYRFLAFEKMSTEQAIICDNSMLDSHFNELKDSPEIVHPYGSFGELTKNPYGSPIGPEQYSDFSKNLKVIREEDGISQEFERCREILTDSRKIIFLGFGFDETNLKNLGFDLTADDLIKGNSYTNDIYIQGHDLEVPRYNRIIKMVNSNLKNTENISPMKTQSRGTKGIIEFIKKTGCFDD
jgi:hypothetical protein